MNNVFSSLKNTAKKNKLLVLLLILAIISSIIFSLLPPLVLEEAVNEISLKKEISLSLAFLYLGLTILSYVFESLQNIALTVFGQKLTKDLRYQMVNKLEKLPTSYFNNNDVGKLTSLFVNDADVIDALYSEGIISLVVDLIKMIGILIIVFIKSLGLGLILLVLLPLVFFLTRYFQKKTLKAQKKNREAIAKINNHVPESIENIEMIHIYNKENYMENKYDNYIKESFDAINEANFCDSVYSPIINIIQALCIAVLMLCAIQKEGFTTFFNIDVGASIALIAYVSKIFSPIESLGMELQNIQSARAGVIRINDFLKEKENIYKEIKVDSDKYDIHFNDVSFSYDKEKVVLSHLNLDIKEGEHLTFIGRTGCGKSTLFRLLLGLYEPDCGSVTIANRNPINISKEERRALFGVVEQSFTQVKGTIKDQITLNDDSYSDEEVIKALEKVGLKEHVLSLKNGIHETIKKEYFSQGELQLLSIARAIISSPKILLLDEMTADLDSKTEEKILLAINEVSKGRTVLSISHRYSKALNNDRFINLEK